VWRMPAAVDMNSPYGMHVFVQQNDVSRRLDDLNRKGHVGQARNARQVALGFRIGGRAILEVLFLLGCRPRLIRNLVAFDDALSGGDISLGTMILDVPRGG